MYYIYMLRCQDGSLYTGITPDLKRRMRQHCGRLSGGAKYTRSHPPKALACSWETDGHTAAAQFEIACKRLTREKKLLLAAAPERWQEFLPQLLANRYTPVPVKPLEQYLEDTCSKAENAGE